MIDKYLEAFTIIILRFHKLFYKPPKLDLEQKKNFFPIYQGFVNDVKFSTIIFVLNGQPFLEVFNFGTTAQETKKTGVHLDLHFARPMKIYAATHISAFILSFI